MSTVVNGEGSRRLSKSRTTKEKRNLGTLFKDVEEKRKHGEEKEGGVPISPEQKFQQEVKR